LEFTIPNDPKDIARDLAEYLYKGPGMVDYEEKEKGWGTVFEGILNA
jgi:hypothetical protein